MLELLLLIVVANAAPVLARDVLGERWDAPLDGGRRAADGRPLLGQAKTWRGVTAAVFAITVAAPLLGRSALDGALVGLLAMTGDTLASYLKRRRGYGTSARAPCLDTLPEAALPGALLAPCFGLAWWQVPLLVVLFHAIDRLLSPLLYRLHLRRRPW